MAAADRASIDLQRVYVKATLCRPHSCGVLPATQVELYYAILRSFARFTNLIQPELPIQTVEPDWTSVCRSLGISSFLEWI